MVKNISEYLYCTAIRYPDKVAFVDGKREITFRELYDESCRIAMGLSDYANERMPVVVFLEKSVECIAAFVGTAMSGNFYSPIDVDMPMARIEKIRDVLNPQVILTDKEHQEQAKEFANGAQICIYEEMMQEDINEVLLSQINKLILDSDLLYVLFTSGSTGLPKGVMISERGVIDFVEWATEKYGFDKETTFGNQTPFYFSFSIYEIYITLKTGATTYIIPHDLFSVPVRLMEYLHDNRVNTIIWVPSALTMVSAFRALKSPFLTELKNVFFGAEVMPIKQLNRWRKVYSDVRFVNLYGPTEVTDTCSAYEVKREFNENEMLPIGTACRNKEIILLNDADKRISDGETGEICVRGSGLAYGYYNQPERTNEVFVQNPLNPLVPEIIYRTGDLARYNSYGELVYVGRKDFQIKHMGYRIELGEIEVNVLSIDGVEGGCCLFEAEKSKIWLFYVGNIKEKELEDKLIDLLPVYMLPTVIRKLKEMPSNLNGKIDRQKLMEQILEES